MDNSKITSGFFNQARETMVWDKRKKDLENRFLKIIEHAFYKSKAYGEIFRSAGMEPGAVESRGADVQRNDPRSAASGGGVSGDVADRACRLGAT